MGGELRSVVELAQAAEVARKIADAAQDDYVAAVRTAIDAGVGVPAIAEATGNSRTGIYQALRRRSTWRGVVPSPRKSDDEIRAERKAERARDIAEYRIERERQVLEQEARTRGYAGDVAHEKATGVAQPITYAQWMRANREQAPV